MLKLENTEVLGWEHAIRGMRNPMNSWEKSDSGWDEIYHSTVDKDKFLMVQDDGEYEYYLGPNDQDLMKRLRNAGTDHRKFMRMITVYVDITAPLYWWKEFDTYKVGTVANSCSTMHKIAAKEFTLEDFSHEHLIVAGLNSLKRTIDDLNSAREGYLDERIKQNPGWRKEVWWQMIQLLPSSYNQRRTVQMNYEVLANIYKSRRNHKLDEWHTFCDWIEELPYSELITGMTKSERVARLGKKLSEGFNEGFKSVKVPDVEEMREAFANALGISKDELLERLTPSVVQELMDMVSISHEEVSDSTALFLKKSMTIPATAEDIEDSVDISHLVDITCSWDIEEFSGERIYAIGPGFTREDLTPYELYLLEKSEEYEKRKKEK